MKREPAKRSSLFLMELIIAILLFSVAAMVCVQIFVKAHLISRQTQEMSHALEKVSGFTELFLSDGSLNEQIAQITDGMAETDGESDFRVYYDADWQICKAENASYLVKIQTVMKDGLLHASFTAENYEGKTEGNIIYSTETDLCPNGEKEDAS